MFSLVQLVDGIYHICSKKCVKDTGDGIIAKWGPRTFYKACVIKSSNNKNELKQIKAILENSSTLKVSLQKIGVCYKNGKMILKIRRKIISPMSLMNKMKVSAKISGRTEPREMSNGQENALLRKIETYCPPENSTSLKINAISGSKSKVKKYFCFYCKKLYSKLVLHLERKHPGEPDVQKFSMLPKGCEERRNIMFLGKRGHFNSTLTKISIQEI
ncbi:hypothetical protein JTB14_004467 [Gonioctena quinquepunctata]|nr:hypothetical protein JTB14_004467 [Gonioctena quinquepunctata]